MKSTHVLYIFLIIFSTNAYSTVPLPPIPAERKVKMADHIFVGSVYKVDMVNEKGRQVKRSSAKTGPGLTNTIRLYIRVEPDGVLMTDVDPFPREFIIPLWQMFHYSLGQIQEVHKEDYKAIFFLKGKEFEKVTVSIFREPIDDLERVKKLIKEKSVPKKSTDS